ncbi:MAG: hypothetical protein ACP5OH_04355 [Nitrososphaerota archaeon]
MQSSLYGPPTPRSVLIFYSVQEIRTFSNFVTKELMLSRQVILGSNII